MQLESGISDQVKRDEIAKRVAILEEELELD
jgi:hypothetical protein